MTVIEMYTWLECIHNQWELQVYDGKQWVNIVQIKAVEPLPTKRMEIVYEQS